MGTRSGIGYYDKETNTLHAIYCHWDGYLEHNGRILMESYQDLEKIKKLIALGDISVLRAEVDPDPSKPHHFPDYDRATDKMKESQKDVVVAYHRDRGDELRATKIKFEAKTPKTKLFREMRREIDGACFYLFKDGKWYNSPRTTLQQALKESGIKYKKPEKIEEVETKITL